MENKLLKLASLSLVFTTGLLHGQFIATNGGTQITNNLSALSTADSIVDYYNWSGNAASEPKYSFTGPLTLDNFSINTFLYQEGATGPLSFVTVYGSDPTGAIHTVASSVLLEGNTTATTSVRDDPNTSGPDLYGVAGTPNTLTFTTFHEWSNVRTDGYAITDISGFSKLVQSVDPDDSDWSWNLFSGDGSKYTLDLNSDLVLTPVPEPATIGFLAMVGLPLALYIRRRILKK